MKLTKDQVPDHFTCGLAAVDAVPVVLFGINCILIGQILHSPLFTIGAVLCLLGGAIKVLWKFIVAAERKNIWWMFVQMRISMPIGFLIMLVSVILMAVGGGLGILGSLRVGIPSIVCFALGILGMILMGVFAVKLDNSDLKSNWIEQITNGISQAFILAGLILMI